MERRYGRAQFLRDAIALGLPVRQAFSRAALRRQRDLLMRLHHPDRGGSDDRAREINEIYGRMVRWLDERNRSPVRPARAAGASVGDEAGTPQRKLLRKAAAAAVWAVTVAASSYVAIAVRKAKRR